MENCIANYDKRHDDGPQPIGAILAELLAQYEVRFPEIKIAIVETHVAAA
jgi:hypothetical protein